MPATKGKCADGASEEGADGALGDGERSSLAVGGSKGARTLLQFNIVMRVVVRALSAASFVALAPAACGGAPSASAGAPAGAASQGAAAPRSAEEKCEAGAADACAEVADNARDRSPDHAAALYVRACDGANAYACARGASLVQPSDPRRAFAMLEVACAAGFDPSCNDIGFACERGLGTPVDLPRALSMYTTTCSHGAAYGCFNQGIFSETGRGGATKDDAEAARLYRRACDLGYDHACAALGRLTWLGRGVAEDKVGGAKLLETSCRSGYDYACAFLERQRAANAAP